MVFRAVEAYLIVSDNMQSILFDIVQCDIDQILIDYSSEFDRGVKYGRPGKWDDSTMACLKHFKNTECEGWTISTSYGMSGFVIAKIMEFKME